MLSSRLPKDLSPSPFFAELEKVKDSVRTEADFIDMTVSSPLRVGLPFDLQPAVDEARGEFGTWVADAAGRRDAREAVAEYYRERGGAFTAGQIILTASTSEAYSVLFKTFCDPGDVILTPMPGYPLLDTLAQLEHLECAPYFLKFARDKRGSFRFVLDTDSLLAAPERAKILLLVSPHNPTGHCVSRDEWNEAVRFCEENNLILVVDEVFGDYAFSEKVQRSWKYVLDERRQPCKASDATNAVGHGRAEWLGLVRSESPKTRDERVCHPERNEVKSKDLWGAGGGDFINLPEDGPKCPIFWLNGLSKAVGSPQLKLGWMAFYAPREKFEEIRAALEFVEDAYLSVSAPAQALARPMLAASAAYESRIRERLLANWNTLREAFPSKYCPEVLGGWYAVLRLGEDDEEITLRLLREKHVLVQPGFFFDFDEDGWVVISLLQESSIFKEAIRRIKNFE